VGAERFSDPRTNLHIDVRNPIHEFALGITQVDAAAEDEDGWPFRSRVAWEHIEANAILPPSS